MNDKVVNKQKQSLRKLMLFRLKSQPEKDKIYKNQVIFEKVTNNEHFKKAQVVMAYVSMPYEVATHRVIHEALEGGKRVVVPWVERVEQKLIPVEIRNPEKDLIKGLYGIEEPVQDLVKSFDRKVIDLVLVPGLAFDKENYRLGRGRACFDRFLPSLDSKTQTIGLAFDLQLIDRVPHLEHDIPVNFVISN